MPLHTFKNLQYIFILILISVFLFAKDNSGPVPIYYGLNESHSNDWAQCTESGTIAISYFQHNNDHSADGNLVYKTIQPNGTQHTETIISGNRMENSVLQFDSNDQPHIFVAKSDNNNQTIDHFYKEGDEWKSERVIDFENEGGKFIYEMSVDTAPDGTFHLVVLKIRSDPDSEDYWYAYLGANLYYISNSTGNWEKEQIAHYHTFFTMDEYAKMLNRQDIKVDSKGKVHIIYGEQVNGEDWRNSYTILKYATNQSGEWQFETAVDAESSGRYSAGWYASLCLDSNDIPYISCCNIDRVTTGSAMNAKLIFVSRVTRGNWQSETIAQYDDGYYGRDGRDYTGGITHLVFDKNDTPHIVFSDIASSHSGTNYFNLGNIRYATKQDESWDITKIHQHPLPTARYDATEAYDMCLLISEQTNQIKIVGQELKITDMENYECKFVYYTVQVGEQKISDEELLQGYILYQNYPNPFNPSTMINYQLPMSSEVHLEVFNTLGEKVSTLVSKHQDAGQYSVKFDASNLHSGMYFYNLDTDMGNIAKKLILLK